MMATPAEIVALAEAFVRGSAHPDMVSGFTTAEVEEAFQGALFIFRERRRAGPRNRALALFRSWLSKGEREELRQRRHVTLVGERHRYRILPATGITQRVERRKSRWYAVATYCLHPSDWVPPGDVALAHYLLLKTDEAAFLATANEHAIESPWEAGARLRRTRARRAHG